MCLAGWQHLCSYCLNMGFKGGRTVENVAAVESLPPPVLGLILAPNRWCCCILVMGRPWFLTFLFSGNPLARTLVQIGTPGNIHCLFLSFFFTPQCSHCLLYAPTFDRFTIWMDFLSQERTTLKCRWAWNTPWRKLFLPCSPSLFPSSLDFVSLEKKWKNLSRSDWTSWVETQFFWFFLVLLYMKCPEITQKIKSLRESPLKIIELSIKFLWVSKINSALHGLCALSFSYSSVLDLFFYLVDGLEPCF